MRHGLNDIYYSAQHNQCSLIIRTFRLHGVVGADLRPDKCPVPQVRDIEIEVEEDEFVDASDSILELD
jgi:hypothetical protein